MTFVCYCWPFINQRLVARHHQQLIEVLGPLSLIKAHESRALPIHIAALRIISQFLLERVTGSAVVRVLHRDGRLHGWIRAVP